MMSMPSAPRQSTTMAPPPPVVVTTATRRPAAGRVPRKQGRRLDQALQHGDPCDAEMREQRIDHVVPAGQRSRMGGGELAPRFRTSELVGDDGFAGGMGAPGEGCERSPVP